jgi:MFS family permease
MWNAATGISMTAGPVLGGFLVQLFGWRSVFFVNLPIGVAGLVYSRVLRESKSPTPRPFDLPGQFAVGLGLFALVYALISGTGDGWTSPLILSLFACSLLAWLGFLWIQRTAKHPTIPLRYLAQPTLSGASLLAVLAFSVTAGYQFVIMLYLQEVRGFSPLHAGLLTVPMTLAVLLVSPIAGRLTGTRGSRYPAMLAMWFLAVGTALLAATVGVGTSILVLICSFLVMGIGNGLINTPITTAAVSSMPKERAAVASAVATTGRQVGSAVGVALIGSVAFSIAAARSVRGFTDASLHTPLGGLHFSEGIRVGIFVASGLSLLGVVVARWAFSSPTVDHDQPA